MKNPFIPFRISGMMLALFLVLFIGCQNEEELKPAFEPVLSNVDLEKETGLRLTLDNLYKAQPGARTASEDLWPMDFGTIVTTSTVKRIAREDQTFPNYTIRIIPPEGVKNSLEYFTMIGVEGGYRAYILQYQTEDEYISTLAKPNELTGYTRILDLSRNIIAENLYREGELISKTSGVNSSRSNEEYTNCDCEYEYETVITYSNFATQEVKGYKEIVGIVCDCEKVSTIESGGSGGGSNTSGSGNIDYNGPGEFVPNPSTYGGSGGSTSTVTSTANNGSNSLNEIGFGSATDCLIFDDIGNCMSEAKLWEEQIDDSQLTDPCAKKIWKELEQTNVAFKQLKEFLGENPIADISLNNVSQSEFKQIAGDAYAGTVGSNVNGQLHIDIYFNPSFLNNASSAAVTTIFMHELIHAEILTKIWQSEENPEIFQMNFPILYQKFIDYQNTPDWHHDAIAQLYRDSIKKAMQVTGFNSSNNEALSWLGLTKTVSWIDLLTQTQRSDYRNIHNHEKSKGGC